MRHTIDGSFFQNGKPGPIVVNVGFQNPLRRVGRQSTGSRLLVRGVLFALLLAAAKDSGQQARLLFLLAVTRRFPGAFFLALLPA